MKLFSGLLALLGAAAATFGTFGCIIFIADEAEMPKSLLNK